MATVNIAHPQLPLSPGGVGKWRHSQSNPHILWRNIRPLFIRMAEALSPEEELPPVPPRSIRRFSIRVESAAVLQSAVRRLDLSS